MVASRVGRCLHAVARHTDASANPHPTHSATRPPRAELERVVSIRIFVGSLMIFFGTLMLAGLLALGDPGGWGMPALHFEGGSRSLAVADWTRIAAAFFGVD